MSTNRVSPEAGWVSTKRLPKGPNGRALCRQCGQEVPKGRRSFCGDACVEAWVVKTNPTRMRAVVFKRDQGVCAICGLDTVKWAEDRSREWRTLNQSGLTGYDLSQARESFRRQYPVFFTSRTSYWDADHIVPVVEGGGECGIENIRTLCVPCHKQVTAQLAARRAAPRRAERAAAQAPREIVAGKVRLF